MSVYVLLIAIVCLVSIICCLIMKKIQPEKFKLYVVYVFFVIVIFVVVVSIYLFWG